MHCILIGVETGTRLKGTQHTPLQRPASPRCQSLSAQLGIARNTHGPCRLYTTAVLKTHLPTLRDTYLFLQAETAPANGISPWHSSNLSLGHTQAFREKERLVLNQSFILKRTDTSWRAGGVCPCTQAYTDTLLFLDALIPARH